MSHPNPGIVRAMRILQRVFQDYCGNLAVRLWNDETLCFNDAPQSATLVFDRARPLRDMILFRDPLRLAEAYFSGMVDVEGDIYEVLKLKDHLCSFSLSAREKTVFAVAALLLRDRAKAGDDDRVGYRRPWYSALLKRNGKEHNREAISYHYDVSNEFYGLWLDRQMVYSCAYFERPDQDLDQAQCNKLDLICRKLRLRPGERLLDIGCGWGALVLWAARHYGVHAHGVTLSRNQFEFGQRMIREQGLEHLVTLELKDYRDLAGEAGFDKIASVGMFEHVGLKNLPLYFRTVRRLLKPDGLFLNHGITHEEDGWEKCLTTQFINRYVFPDGELDRVSSIQGLMEESCFEILHVEALRPHYALTLRHWVKRLEERREEALRHTSESVYRVWRLYMAACAQAFEEGSLGVYQILAGPKGSHNWPEKME
ncbi:MAG: cyclopropane-fatty-acyl-phospholipid synthase family protein [Sulfuricella sp.]